jgi:hypothetical protein
VPDSGSAPIRFGVLHSGAALENWQSRCLQQLTSLPDVRSVELPPIPLQESARAQALARVRDCNLDFLLCFIEGALAEDMLDLARHGAWRYQLGDWLNYRGPAGGFWEVYDHSPVSTVLLARVTADPDVIVVLREAVLRTRALSVSKNRHQLLNGFTHWPAQVCRDIRLGKFAAPNTQAALRARTAARPAPRAWHRAVLFLRIAARIAAAGFRSLFRHDQWNIGIVDCPIEQFISMSGPPQAKWLTDAPRSEFRADPFGTLRDGRPTILYEHFSYRDQLGYIVAIETPGSTGTRVHIGPEKPVHLSYPFLFESGGQLLCVPESSAAKEIALYEIERFPDRWKKIATLIAECELVDATLFQFDGRWWLAGSDLAEKGANSELHLWFASNLSGPWQPHPGNPVKVDVRSARPAGAPFWVGDQLYRPAQDCSSSYGARVSINRITALTPTEFREEVAATVSPDPRGEYSRGLHTLSRFGDRTLIDGKRSVFVPAEFFRVLRHYLR